MIMAKSDDDQAANLTALTPDQMALLLSKAGAGPVTADEVRADIEAGAPADGQGRLHLLTYAAWLARDVQSRGCG